MFNKNEHSEVPFLSRSVLFMDAIVVSKDAVTDAVTEILKGMNPSNVLHDELHSRFLKELAVQFLPIFCSTFLTLVKSPGPRNGLLQRYVPSKIRMTGLLHVTFVPVSLTCVPCKLVERIVCSNIMPHLDECYSKKAQLTTIIMIGLKSTLGHAVEFEPDIMSPLGANCLAMA